MRALRGCTTAALPVACSFRQSLLRTALPHRAARPEATHLLQQRNSFVGLFGPGPRMMCTKADDGAEAVQLTNFKGIVEDQADGQRTLQKLHTSSNDAWNAMVASTSPIEGFQSDRNGVSFVVSRSDPSSPQGFMCGLASASRGLHGDIANNVDYKSIAFAVEVCNGNFNVYEKGTHQGQYGNVKAGDTVTVALNEVTKKVDYSVNGQVRYTSQLLPEFPLYVKLCALRCGPLLEQLCWTSRMQPELGEGSRQARALHIMAERNVKLEVEKQKLEAELEVANALVTALRSRLRTAIIAAASAERASAARGESVTSAP